MIPGVRSFIRRMSSIIPQVPDVDIDESGVFKYILVKLKSSGEEKLIVRGYGECPYHADIDDKLSDQLKKLKTGGAIVDCETEVLGGGRIEHTPEKKYIKVYGYSQGFGKANHEDTVKILKTKYPEYNITWSNGGY
ncbi:14 kDa phosphohistidine phosphatase-like [Coccinella septempunctata]|uniref:14 kDa phosphohistidine phosphatase-like n=1 Tax=Coccinella septempunctata TaxID=41139 RepID=UPI001D090EFE|nr:14 kDa phosphohistidine phosphatase-like [Coccinella septempunctata]